MNWLKTEVGFVGWRFDMVVGYAPTFTKTYMEKTSPEFAVGELYQNVSRGQDGRPLANQDKHRATLVDAAGGAVTAFDFTTKMVLGAAVQGELWRMKDDSGKPPGMIGTKPENGVSVLPLWITMILGLRELGLSQMIKSCWVMFTSSLILVTPVHNCK